jgi:hypothetical protein
MGVANLPKVVKPGAGGEATTECSHRAPRGGWGGRARTDASRNLGGPAAWVEPNLKGEDISLMGEVGSRRGQYELGSGVMPVEQRGPTVHALMQEEGSAA